GNRLEQLPLAGVNDESENVYCTGHGVYWVVYEVSNLTTNGENTVEVLTSRGEPGNKLDGRVYGAVLVAACEDPTAPMSSYQIKSGNVNLHGKGWSGSLAYVNDHENILFNVGNFAEIESAKFYTVYLTGSKGLPNYLEFNGEMLGVQPSYLSEVNGIKLRDIANEVSYDASGGEGFPSSYFDIECFDVLGYAQPLNNSVTFIRGLDLNGDGEVDDQEGEDYLHPVMAVLVLGSKESSPALPDLYPEIEVDEEELVEGINVEIPFVINNPGGVCDETCTVSFRVDGSEVSTSPVIIGPSGLYRSTFSWSGIKGEHLFELSVDPDKKIKELNEENNACKFPARVRTKPDLSVSLGDPVKIETEKDSAAASLLFLPLLTLFGFRRKKPLSLLLILVLILVSFSGCVEQKPAEETSAFMIPVIIENNGEATARNFDAELYLDGECATVLNIRELAGQTSIEEKIRVEALRGEHTLSVKVDERKHIIESDEDNNEFETLFNFV
ncbi:MAG: CARDB domain-containing protein, partial [Methanosarcinaceae archaeon]|nr:CARDB domain-containing protein [Methanosarcinaceae archaeon]